MIGFIAQILDHRQFFCRHLSGDLLQYLRPRYLIGQRADDDVTVLDFIAGAQAYRTIAGLVHLQQILARGDDLGVGGIIGTQHMLAQFGHAGLGLFQQTDAGARHLTGIVGRNIGGHPHRNAGGAVE